MCSLHSPHYVGHGGVAASALRPHRQRTVTVHRPCRHAVACITTTNRMHHCRRSPMCHRAIADHWPCSDACACAIAARLMCQNKMRPATCRHMMQGRQSEDACPPSPLGTGSGSPVSAASLIEDRPPATAPSTGILSPGSTVSRSPFATAAAGTSFQLPSPRASRAVAGSSSWTTDNLLVQYLRKMALAAGTSFQLPSSGAGRTPRRQQLLFEGSVVTFYNLRVNGEYERQG